MRAMDALLAFPSLVLALAVTAFLGVGLVNIIGAVVWGMDTSNVDRVLVGGRPVLRGGALEADVGRARTMATEARGRVAAAAGLAVGAVSEAGR